MKLACFAVTKQAFELAKKLQNATSDVLDIYVLNKYLPDTKNTRVQGFRELKEAIASSFSVYDGLVFVMSTGIVVRMIAPLLKSKLQDPAVVVFDEQGKHGISLLSGHVGQANSLTYDLCRAINAEPVITTATDNKGIVAPDVIAARLALRPYPKSHIKNINAAVLAGKRAAWYIDKTLVHYDFYKSQLERAEQIVSFDCNAVNIVITTEKKLPAVEDIAPNKLYLVPRKLIAGVGCRKGTSVDEVLTALDTACHKIGIDKSFVAAIASTIVKKQETGLLLAAEKLSCPLYFYENAAMAKNIFKYKLIESDFVKKTIGIGNVAEAAAYTYVGERGGRLALPKTKFEKVTVALLWEK